MDDRKRALYDTLGEEGLKDHSWEVGQKLKTPEEVRLFASFLSPPHPLSQPKMFCFSGKSDEGSVRQASSRKAVPNPAPARRSQRRFQRPAERRVPVRAQERVLRSPRTTGRRCGYSVAVCPCPGADARPFLPGLSLPSFLLLWKRALIWALSCSGRATRANDVGSSGHNDPARRTEEADESIGRYRRWHRQAFVLP